MARLGRLQHIKLEGYRSIRQLDLALTPLNILIGPNGAGKSNFISFFTFMNRLMSGELAIHVATKLNGADRMLFFGRKSTPELSIQLTLDVGQYISKLVSTGDDRLVFDLELLKSSLVLEGDSDVQHFVVKEPVPRGRPESSFSQSPLPYSAQRLKDCLNDWKVYHFHDTSDTAKVKGAYSIHANDRLMPQGDNLAAFLYGLRDTPAYANIVRMVQRVAPFFHDFIFQTEPNDMIRLRWKHKGSDDYFDATMLSDGTLRFICLTTLLLQPKLPTIILLDEPELGLHPFAMQLLAAMMRSASEQTQIIASTQSVTLANQFSWQDMVVVDQVNNESKFRRLEEQEVAAWLERYKMGDIWEMNLLGGTPE